MDPITQGALGAAAAQTLLQLEPERPHRIWMAGAIGGMAADLDILIRSSNNPMLSLLYHRHFTHSLIFIPIGGFIIALCLLLFPYFRSNWKVTLWAALIGYATHGILDAATSYGTVLFWPFSLQRINWDFIFIINPVFTALLVIGTAIGIIFHTRKAIAAGLISALIFLGLNALQHHKALEYFKTDLKKHYPDTQMIRAMPAGLSSTIWRGIAVSGNRLIISNLKIPWAKKPYAIQTYSFPYFRTKDLPRYVQLSKGLQKDYAIFNWFTSGYLVLVSKTPLILADGRYTIGKNPIRSLWGIEFKPEYQHVKKLRLIKVRTMP